MMDQFIEQLFSLDHWPWLAVAAILSIVGQFASRSVFTRKRAYQQREGWRGYFIQSFFWWGRESLMLQPILLGIFIGLSWTDPEGTVWSAKASAAYFGSAGVAANFGWMILKSRAKQKGINLSLLGQSEPPKP
jgi:hypothetical protein